MNIINSVIKPKKSSVQLIKQLEAKGVKFSITSRISAYHFLSERNNYMRLASYRKNYCKETFGQQKGQYKNLEFAYLIELSTIVMYLRQHILKMCLDIEHCLKVQLLHHLETNTAEDGYQTVNEFLNDSNNSYIKGSLSRNKNATYSGDLAKRYFKYTYNNGLYSFDCPAWVFTELLQFGDFLKFYKFYYSKYGVKYIDDSILNLVKSLRNACAHNNCVLHDLHKGNIAGVPTIISKYVSNISGIGRQARQQKLSTQFLLEFVGLLYVYDTVVSPDVKKHTLLELKSFANGRLILHSAYFNKNYLLKTSFDFCEKLLTIWIKTNIIILISKKSIYTFFVWVALRMFFHHRAALFFCYNQ